MKKIEKQILEVLHNINWQLKPHKSHVELLQIKGRNVLIRGRGVCIECKIDCIGAAFKDRMPDIELLRI